uniref:Uncharacterized protein n=1 Tax=Anguilla anguilla TaxID=7936 RepID=A0A0E9UHZ6_ANGAN
MRFTAKQNRGDVRLFIVLARNGFLQGFIVRVCKSN